MCGRVTLTKTGIRDIADELDAELAAGADVLYRPRYNVAPSETHWIVERVAEHRVLLPAVWGYLASGRPLINVRGEQVGSGGGFRHAFADRRCAVVTDGFYEWTKDKRPYWFHRPDGGLILLAGLFQPPPAVAAPAAPAASAVRASAADPAAATRPRFTILTTRPNRVVAEIHDRMPVVLAPDRVDEWLAAPDPARAARLIAPAAEDALIATAVSRRVSSVKNDDPECLTPASEEARRGEQGSLFQGR
jgi:putative SOS response-associated peptidase YedK